MSNFFILLYRFFHNHKKLYFIFLGLLLFFIIFFSLKIKIEENISSMSGKGTGTDAFDYVVTHFNISDKLVVHFRLTDTVSKPDAELLTASAGKFVSKLSSRFDSSYIKSITGTVPDTLMSYFFTFFLDHLPLYLNDQDYTHIDSLITPAGIDKAIGDDYRILVSPASAALKNNVMKDPLGITALALQKARTLQPEGKLVVRDGFIMTPDKSHLLLFISSANTVNETSKNTLLVHGIEKILTEVSSETNHQVKGEYFGVIAMSVGNADRLKKDIMLTLVIALSLIIVFVGWYFRSIKIPILSFLPALFGGGFALSVLFLIQGTVSAIALGVGSVILGLIVDYALYLINHFRKKGDIEVVLKEMSQTVVLCFLTSAGAFLCLIFLHSGVLHDLGWFASLSVAGAALFALVILPHFINEKDIKIRSIQRNTFVDRIASVSFEKKYGLIIFLVIIGVISLFTMRKAGFEKDMMSMNYTRPELQAAQNNLDRINYESLKNIYVISTGKTLDEALLNHERTEKYIRNLEEKKLIVQSAGIGDLLPSDPVQRSGLHKWKQFWTAEKKNSLEKMISASGKKYKFRENAFSVFFTLLNSEQIGRAHV